MRRPAGLAHRFFQHSGCLAIASMTLAELHSGAHKRTEPAKLLTSISELLEDVTVLDFNSESAEQFGKLRGNFLKQGHDVATADLIIASIALVHDLTLVTHNTADYQNIPGLRLEDWLIP